MATYKECKRNEVKELVGFCYGDRKDAARLIRVSRQKKHYTQQGYSIPRDGLSFIRGAQAILWPAVVLQSNILYNYRSSVR